MRAQLNGSSCYRNAGCIVRPNWPHHGVVEAGDEIVHHPDGGWLHRECYERATRLGHVCHLLVCPNSAHWSPQPQICAHDATDEDAMIAASRTLWPLPPGVPGWAIVSRCVGLVDHETDAHQFWLWTESQVPPDAVERNSNPLFGRWLDMAITREALDAWRRTPTSGQGA